ncbi:MAG: ABC transporter permease [Rhodothermus sp.]|nr:ABC transporter permease [Rhodothermus sp.]
MSLPEVRQTVRLLRGAALLFGVLGLGIALWLADKAIRYPHILARQGDAQAPLWIPMLVFVLLCTGASIFLFLRAARRVARGETLDTRWPCRHRSARAPNERNRTASTA